MTVNPKPGGGPLLDQRSQPKRPLAGFADKETKIFLRVERGPDTGRAFNLSRGGSFILGRGRVDIVLSDDKVSSRHAEIKLVGPGQYHLYDLSSANGTYLNGARVERRQFGHGDELRVGDSIMRVSVIEGKVRGSGR